jgi:hypothetical protein
MMNRRPAVRLVAARRHITAYGHRVTPVEIVASGAHLTATLPPCVMVVKFQAFCLPYTLVERG